MLPTLADRKTISVSSKYCVFQNIILDPRNGFFEFFGLRTQYCLNTPLQKLKCFKTSATNKNNEQVAVHCVVCWLSCLWKGTQELAITVAICLVKRHGVVVDHFRNMQSQFADGLMIRLFTWPNAHVPRSSPRKICLHYSNYRKLKRKLDKLMHFRCTLKKFKMEMQK